jgi:glycerol-3-phosphate dehydrogenase (NAD(P)+)
MTDKVDIKKTSASAAGRCDPRHTGRRRCVGSTAMDIRVTVLGSGSWGTTVAALAAGNVPTTLWSRRPELAEQIDTEHENGDYLAGFRLPEALRATADLEEAVLCADVLVVGVPSQGFRGALEAAKPYLRPWVPVVSLSKGLELDTRLRMSQIIEDVLPGHPVGILTGPNLAKEILAGQAAASVVAMDDHNVARALQKIFQADLFRVYTNEDIIGCELGGVLKNVVAIASGMADGLGAGDNTRSAVITRGLSEITRMGVALGGQPLTFSGLAGMGDLVATCISQQSRNRHVGERLGHGETIEEIIAAMNMVAEGVKTSKVVKELSDELGCDMPIASEVYGVCHQGCSATDAYAGLLNRGTGREMDGITPAR